VPRNIGCKHADLAVGDLAPTGSSPVAKDPRAGVLPRNTTGCVNARKKMHRRVGVTMHHGAFNQIHVERHVSI
jgi:hypothetical protein